MCIMKLLFDQNISYRIENKLSSNYGSSKHISNLGLNNSTDIDIWNYVKSEQFVIVTFDSDFYDLSLINGCPPKIIWIRKGNLTTNQIVVLLEEKHLLIRNFIENPDKMEVACIEIND
jgi:predicted nuclease of predicted toxin-antitoxin system